MSLRKILVPVGVMVTIVFTVLHFTRKPDTQAAATAVVPDDLPSAARMVDREFQKRWVQSRVETAEFADDLTILYGGSCKPSNAPELFACADVDGGLIGGASLSSRDFVDIIKSF